MSGLTAGSFVPGDPRAVAGGLKAGRGKKWEAINRICRLFPDVPRAAANAIYEAAYHNGKMSKRRQKVTR